VEKVSLSTAVGRVNVSEFRDNLTAAQQIRLDSIYHPGGNTDIFVEDSQKNAFCFLFKRAEKLGWSRAEKQALLDVIERYGCGRDKTITIEEGVRTLRYFEKEVYVGIDEERNHIGDGSYAQWYAQYNNFVRQGRTLGERLGRAVRLVGEIDSTKKGASTEGIDALESFLAHIIDNDTEFSDAVRVFNMHLDYDNARDYALNHINIPQEMSQSDHDVFLAHFPPASEDAKKKFDLTHYLEHAIAIGRLRHQINGYELHVKKSIVKRIQHELELPIRSGVEQDLRDIIRDLDPRKFSRSDALAILKNRYTQSWHEMDENNPQGTVIRHKLFHFNNWTDF